MAKEKIQEVAAENTATETIIDNIEALQAKIAAMREAQRIFANYTQEQVDKTFFAAADAANKQRIPLASSLLLKQHGRCRG